MSGCISRHGEYSSHVWGDDFYCERCGAEMDRAEWLASNAVREAILGIDGGGLFEGWECDLIVAALKAVSP